jgi:hypothetical protein
VQNNVINNLLRGALSEAKGMDIMMKSKKMLIGIVSLISAFTLSACAGGNEEANPNEEINESAGMDHSGMNHSSSGEVSEDLKVAKNPTYEVGSKVIIEEGHMEGMEGADATIVGAYETTAYAISYTPTTDREKSRGS